MAYKPLLIITALLLVGAGCTSRQSFYRPGLQNEGQVVVYLQPLPQEVEKFRFRIEGTFAVASSGTRYPLDMVMSQIDGTALIGRQKRLAGAVLPPGNYTGLSLAVGRALRLGEDGETALLVPEAEINIDLPFDIVRKEALALFLSLRTIGVMADGAVFRPEFTLAAAGRQLASLTGYASNTAANLVTVFDKNAMQVVDTIATGQQPKGVVIDRFNRRAYVACFGDDIIEEIDILEGRVVGTIRLRIGDGPLDLALAPDGRTLVSANYGSNSASIIDAPSRQEIAHIGVGQKPMDVAVDPSGLRAYVVNSLSNTISVLDLSRPALAATLSVDVTPVQGAFDRRGERFLVIGRDSPDLTVIDAPGLNVLGKIYVGYGAAGIVVDPQTNLAYIAKRFGGEISIVDPAVQIFIDTITVDGSAARMAIDDQQNSLFVVLPELRKLQKINRTSKRITSELDLAEEPHAVAVANQR
jgi:YVTN family beta-propeller protein